MEEIHGHMREENKLVELQKGWLYLDSTITHSIASAIVYKVHTSGNVYAQV